MSEENKATLKKANAAVAEGRYEDFLAFCTDDTRWTMVGDRILEGKEAVRQWMEDSYAEPPDNKVAEMIAEGDFLTAVGEITVKDKSGKATHYSYCDVWRLRGGKLFELQAFVVETKT
ncbi:MAG: nuclear transport factor 2 family protein [Pseudoxanthomonas sp.]